MTLLIGLMIQTKSYRKNPAILTDAVIKKKSLLKLFKRYELDSSWYPERTEPLLLLKTHKKNSLLLKNEMIN